MRGEGGEGTDSKLFGAYGRDLLKVNGKLLLGFSEDNELALLNRLFCTPNVSYTSKVPTARGDKHVWTLS